MSHRFFSAEPVQGQHAVLRGTEAHHLVHVLRLSRGSEVTLFDGSGAEFQARVAEIHGDEVTLEVLRRNQPRRELPLELTLVAAVPKGERSRWMIEKLVELGAAQFVPLIAQRSVVRPREKALERMRRVVIEASKQCGRNRLMEIAPPIEWGDLISGFGTSGARAFAHPQGIAVSRWLQQELHSDRLPRPPAPRVILAVGPEGGLTSEEVHAAHEAGWTAVSLGTRTLRIETAAVACCAAVALLCE